MRADLLLFRLRLAKSRALAQARIAEGHMRLNNQRLTARDKQVAVGDVLTLLHGSGADAHVQVVQIIALPDRRGPPAEAQGCYRALDADGPIAIADAERPPVHVDPAERIKGKRLT